MKRIIYIISFVVLGVLLQFLLHAGIEIWYINLLLKDFPRYSLGLSWSDWYLIHHTATIILLIIGVLFGFWCGKFFWKKIYEGKKKIIIGEKERPLTDEEIEAGIRIYGQRIEETNKALENNLDKRSRQVLEEKLNKYKKKVNDFYATKSFREYEIK